MMLVEALATVLMLGNIVFTPDGENDSECTTSTHDLLMAAQILDIEPDVLEHAMTRRLVETARDSFEVPLLAEAAKDSLDALVKRIYAFTFAWVVSSVNDQTCGEEGDGVISLLDIYGFENFDTNRFEQLCINYVNEKLHKKYMDDNFARFQKEYESEGIAIFDFAKLDNDPVLQLFDGASGLIASISEECLKPQGTSVVSHVFRPRLNHGMEGEKTYWVCFWVSSFFFLFLCLYLLFAVKEFRSANETDPCRERSSCQ